MLACSNSTEKVSDEKESEVIESPEDNSENLEEQLVGTWSNLELRVVANKTSEDSKDWEVIAECHQGNWEEQMQIKPIITDFTKQGRWSSEHRDLENHVFYVPKGDWWVEGDSLYMKETEPDTVNFYTYLLEFEDGNAKFTSLLDWDQDGESDDLYVGVQKRVGTVNP